MQTQRQITIEDVCNKLRPVFGKKIDEIYFKYATADSREAREEISQILYALYQKNLNKLLSQDVLLEPPKQELDGKYSLATIDYANKNVGLFNLREQDWIRHICISGMSGSGKTTLGFHIIKNFIDKKKPFLIFDWKKSFRPLIKVDPELMLFTIGNDSVSNLFRMNINEPPKGVSPKEWINVLCDLLTESFFVSFGVHKVLLETLDQAFKEWGIYDGSKNYPTWNHIKWRLEEKLHKTSGREAGWIESSLRIASLLTFGSFGKMCNYKGEDRINIEQLLKKKVIFELNSLGNIEKKFFCEFILAYIYKSKKANQNLVNPGFEHAILVDEAHNIFLKDKTHFVNESVTDMIYREMREYGTSLICLDQHVSKLSDTVKGNSACHIAFQQQLPQDIWDISGIMQLKEKQEFFSKLPVGSAIVKLSERYAKPFLIRVDDVGLKKELVSDNDIKNRMQAIFQAREIEQGRDEEFRKDLMQDPKIKQSELKEVEVRVPNHPLYDGELEHAKVLNWGDDNVVGLTPKQEVLIEFVNEKLNQKWTLTKIKEFMENRKEQGEYTSNDVFKAIENFTTEDEEKTKVYKEKITFETPNLSDAQKRFIAFLQANPDHEYSTVELYKQVGLSARKGNKIKDELLEKQLIKINEVKYTKGWKKIIKLNG